MLRRADGRCEIVAANDTPETMTFNARAGYLSLWSIDMQAVLKYNYNDNHYQHTPPIIYLHWDLTSCLTDLA